MTDDLTVGLWGDGGWADYARRSGATPPAEPAAPAQVQLDILHPVFGDRPLFVKWLTGWLPVGWIPAQTATWEQLFHWNRSRPPTVLEPPPVCEVTP